MSIRIAKGLKSTFKNARVYTLEQAFLELDKYTDNYEVLNPDFNRVYGDIDGKDMECSEEEFWKIDSETREAIETFLNNSEYCLLSASSYTHRKISWRFVITNLKTTLKNNKRWVEGNIHKINLPKGVNFDSAPYGKNQKIRMLGSNKDGENRPLKLVKGEKIDTLISYTEDCGEATVIPESETKVKTTSDTKRKLNPLLLRKIVMNIKNDEKTTWEEWYKVSQALFNEGGDLDLFLSWSSKSEKHRERNCVKHWGSLKLGEDGRLSSGSLFYWSRISDPVEYEKIILEYAEPDSYFYKKVKFEKENFKLKNPLCFIRETDKNLQLLKESDLFVMYANDFYYEGEKKLLFVKSWVQDADIRTYEELVFCPMKTVEDSQYNIFRGFPTQKKEGDVSVMKDLLWYVSGKNQEVFNYVENYFAHLIQKPYEKAKKCLVFWTEAEGAGKDTFLDAIGEIIGPEYFYNTGDSENQVFCRFNGHLKKTLLLKLEEVSFEVNKKFQSNLLNLITAKTQSYENKGQSSINLDDYKRIVMTTNKSVPVYITESDRRFVLINCSEDKVGDYEYWKQVYAALEKPETLQAYHWYLANKDISSFDLEKRPITEFYKEVKLSLRPYHASFFQRWLAHNGELYEKETKSATEWMEEINSNSKFSVNLTKFGRDIKQYVEAGAFERKDTKFGVSYTIVSTKMLGFLKKKGWWVEVGL